MTTIGSSQASFCTVTKYIDQKSTVLKRNEFINPDANLNLFTYRTHNCGQVNRHLIGQRVQLCGWLEYQRFGKFLVLRDSYGMVQLNINNKQLQKIAKKCNFESVLKISGEVFKRPDKDINPNMMNGDIEVHVDDLIMLNNSNPNIPFIPRDFMNVNEQTRLKYRHIDLRRSTMIRNIRLRSSFIMALRNYLVDKFGFTEIETPTLFKETPGGAQEFIVPTNFKDRFYNLVQSPQQFKQILMMGGLDRYFQVARCYRNEGTKSDRQPEFTQVK